MSEPDDSAEIVSLADRRAEKERSAQSEEREARRRAADQRARQHQQGEVRKPWMTYILLGLNIAVWLVMVGFGVDAFEPAPQDLLTWGGDFGPRTTSGQWWRLLTATFIHAGLIHLAFNGYFLWVIGRVTEQVFRVPAYAVIYFGSGLCASLVSLAWNPMGVSVGASGALFGVFGAFMGFTLRRREVLPEDFVRSVKRNAMVLIGLNVAIGLFAENVDVAAHGGGLVAGFGIGYLITFLAERPVSSREESVALQRKLALMVGAGVAVVVVAASFALPRYQDVFETYERVEVLNFEAFAAYNGAETDEERIEALEAVAIPAMVKLREEVAAIDNASDEHREQLDRLARYGELSEEAFTRELAGLRSKDPVDILEAKRLHGEAEAALD